MFSILSMFSVFSQLTPCSLSQSNNTTVKLIIHVSDYSSKIISFGFRFRISLSREDKIFRDVIENYFSYSHLARRDRGYLMTKYNKQGNYSLRRPPKLVIPQAVIGKDGLQYIQTCTSKQSYTARVRVDLLFRNWDTISRFGTSMCWTPIKALTPS